MRVFAAGARGSGLTQEVEEGGATTRGPAGAGAGEAAAAARDPLIHGLAGHAVECDGPVGLQFDELAAIAPEEGREGIFKEDSLREAELAEGGSEASAHAQLFTEVVAAVAEEFGPLGGVAGQGDVGGGEDDGEGADGGVFELTAMQEGADLGPRDGVHVGLFAAEDLELVAAEGGYEKAQADGLEHQKFCEGGLQGGEVVVTVTLRKREEGALEAVAVEARLTAGARGGAGPWFEFLGDLDEEGVANALMEFVETWVARVSDGL